MTITDFVQELKKQMLFELKNKKRSGIYGFTQRSMAYNSNKIEGSTLTEKQTTDLFETGTIIGEDDIIYKAKDIEEMTGHFRMFNYTLQHIDEPLSIEHIKQMHYHLKVGVFEDMANGYPCGDFKNRVNKVGQITTSLPKDVPTDMENLLQDYHKTTYHNISDLAKLHARYEAIHPFQDGNGRTGRMILFKECLKNNMLPIIIQDKYKPEYYNYLYLAQTNKNFRELSKFFEKTQQEYYEQSYNFVVPYNTTKSQEHRPLPKLPDGMDPETLELKETDDEDEYKHF